MDWNVAGSDGIQPLLGERYAGGAWATLSRIFGFPALAC
jgi:hypothetical protein